MADEATVGMQAEEHARSGRRDRLVWWVATGAAVLVLSVVTVLRYTVDFLQADGVQQSVMSIQDVDLFFWGQNRFAAFVSLVASPIADPGANLFACLLLNALAFHLLLLVVAWMGVYVLTAARYRWATVATFLVIAGTAHLVITPRSLHVMALESQPYSASWALTLGAFLLWKRREWWAYALAAGMVGVAMGLNQSTLLVAAFLAVLEMVRRRQWVRWVVFGAMWVAWFGVWAVLSARFGGTAGPVPDATQEYFAFRPAQFVLGASDSALAVVEAFRPIRLVLVVGVACVALLLLAPARRVVLLPRLALGLGFTLVYWTIFTGNPWVAANGYAFRYFYPVVVFLVVCFAAPVATVLVGWCLPDRALVPQVIRPAMRDTSRARATVLGAAAVGCALVLVGPVASPNEATVLVQSRPTADWARDNDVTFLSGYYWDMWPTLHRTLEDGRDAAFVTAFKSGGDPQAYRDAFERAEQTAAGARAICVNEQTSVCQLYLDFWTEPGWAETDETCPVPGPTPQLGSPAQRSCVVLRYTGV